MPEEIVKITVTPDGKLEMHVSGVPGLDCVSETEDLVRLAGGEVESQELTGEAYQDVGQRQQDRLWH
jgi:hypothetical protein